MCDRLPLTTQTTSDFYNNSSDSLHFVVETASVLSEARTDGPVDEVPVFISDDTPLGIWFPTFRDTVVVSSQASKCLRTMTYMAG